MKKNIMENDTENFAKDSNNLLEHKCELCPTHFKTILELNDHIKLHFKIYNCDQCNKAIIGDLLYKFHNETKHPPNVPSAVVKCNFCNKCFKRKNHLNDHVRSIHHIRYVNCKFCKENFETKLLLDNHYKEIHPGLSEYPPYICPTCGKDFNKNIGQFKQHLITHYEVKPFICDICGKGCTRKTNLTTHIRMHTGEKPLECKICMKKFARSGNLVCHMRSHTKVRPFKCSYCEKSYSHTTDLRRHKRIHEHTEPKFTCNLCDFKCYEARFLRKHQQRHESVLI